MPFRILHLSDFHIDNLYTPGGNADCDAPLCCQSDQGAPSNGAAPCGYWGDYRSSDSPLHAIEDAVDQAVTQHVRLSKKIYNYLKAFFLIAQYKFCILHWRYCKSQSVVN